MVFTIKGKEVELAFTFRSFKFIKDFKMSEIAQLQDCPFMLIDVTETLLFGAVNNSRKAQFSRGDVAEALEEFANENSLPKLFEDLMGLLEESDFFKQLQAVETETEAEAK